MVIREYRMGKLSQINNRTGTIITDRRVRMETKPNLDNANLSFKSSVTIVKLLHRFEFIFAWIILTLKIIRMGQQSRVTVSN